MVDAKTKAMIALVPVAADAERLAVEEGLSAEELHLTLLFLGDADDWDDDTRSALTDALRPVADREPVEGEAFSLNVFNPDGDDTCIVLGVGGERIADVHQAAVEASADSPVPEQRAPWAAHTTLIYTDDLAILPDLVDRIGPVTYDRLRVAFGNDITDFTLAAPPASQAAPEVQPVDTVRPRIVAAHPLLRNASAYERTPLRAERPSPKHTDDGVVSLRLYDPIDSWGEFWGVSAKEFVSVLDALPEDTREIRLLINSPGGEVWEGLAILNALRAHPARVVAVVEGVAASAASFIAAGVDELHVWENAEIFVHKAWDIILGNEDYVRKAADELGHADRNLASIYAAKAGGDVDTWLTRMRDETTFSAEEALAAGIADKVLKPDKNRADAASQAKARFDLSAFGRKAKASIDPPAVEEPPVTDPDPSADLPAVEPEQPTEPEEEDLVSDLSALRSRLDLDDTADEKDIVAAYDAKQAELDKTIADLKVHADKARAEIDGEKQELRKELELMQNQMKAIGDELAENKASARAAEKKAFLDQAQADGKYKAADRAQWDTDFDEAPGAVRRVLDATAVGAVVPVNVAGGAGSAYAESSDAEWEALVARLDGPNAKAV